MSSQIIFKNIVTTDVSNNTSRGIIEIQDGYLMVGTTIEIDSNYLFIKKIDLFGSEVWTKRIDSDLSNDGLDIQLFRGTQFILCRDSTVVIAYSKSYENIEANPIFVNLDLKGNILWRNEIESSDEDVYIRKIIQTNDGFAGVGNYWKPNDGLPDHLYYCKLNEVGELIWENIFFVEPEKPSYGFEIFELENDGFIIGGISEPAEPINYADHDGLFLKIDSIGNQEWTKFYGLSGADCAPSIVPFEDGYFMEMCMYEWPYVDSYFYMAKIDTNFEVVWDTLYAQVPQSGIQSFNFSTFFNDQNEIFGMFTNEVYDEATDFYWDQPHVAKLSNTGEILWVKAFSIAWNKNTYAWDWKQTSDGGFILTGHEHYPSPQRGWVMKIDSLGNACSSEICDSVIYELDTIIILDTMNVDTTMMDTSMNVDTMTAVYFLNSTSKLDLKLRPNPAHNRIWVKLPDGFDFDKISMEISNLQGQLIKKQDYFYSKELEFNVLDLSPGTYICCVQNNQHKKLCLKFVVD